MELYQEISVWDRRANGDLICYRCLELLNGGGFCVQSVDLYDPAKGHAEQDRFFSEQFSELLKEEAPEKRSGTFPNLQEAIEAHNRDFKES